MQITRSSLDTNRGPGDWFTGAVYVDTVAEPSAGWRINAALTNDAGEVVSWGGHVDKEQYSAPSLIGGDS